MLIYKRGVTGLRVREVAKKARVNLGMFHYHFKSKTAFARRLLNEIYEEFFQRFSLEIGTEGDVQDRLRRALKLLGKFVRDNREIILALSKDILDGENEAAQILDKTFFRHAMLIFKLIKEGQFSGIFRKIPMPLAISFLASSVAGPSLALTIIEKSGAKRPVGIPLRFIVQNVISDKAIEERVDMAINGLSTRQP